MKIDGGFGSENAYAALDVGVDTDGFGEESQNAGAAPLVFFGDGVEVGVAAEGGNLEEEGFVSGLVAEVGDGTGDGVAVAVEALVGEEDLRAT